LLSTLKTNGELTKTYNLVKHGNVLSFDVLDNSTQEPADPGSGTVSGDEEQQTGDQYIP